MSFQGQIPKLISESIFLHFTNGFLPQIHMYMQTWPKNGFFFVYETLVYFNSMSI